MRKLFKVLLLISVVCLCTFTEISSLNADVEYQIIIDDEEDLLTDAEESMLRVNMMPITNYGNVAFVSVKQYSDTGSYAKKLYRSLFGTDSGFLFLIDMGQRNIWIYSDGAIYRVINKAYANTITDNIYRYASRKEYYQCAAKAYEQAEILLRGGRIAQPMKYISNALIALVVALLINFLILTLQREKDINPSSMVPAMTTAVGISILAKHKTKSTSHRHVEYESSGGGGGGGYSGGGGGGGGGGSSGGGGGHSF